MARFLSKSGAFTKTGEPRLERSVTRLEDEERETDEDEDDEEGSDEE